MILRRLLGALLLASVVLPLHRLLDPVRTGLAGAATRGAAEAAWSTGLLGAALVAAAALLLGWRIGAGGLRRGAVRCARAAAVLPSGIWAAGLGLVAFIGSAAAALGLYGGLPTTVDAMAQLLHAQGLQGGSLAVELPGPARAWIVQNGILTGEGWASVYPPGHTAILAMGLALGVPWMVGPVAAAATAVLASLALDRLLVERSEVARAASVAVAGSPFLLLLGGTHLSHTTAAALAALVLWSALRARDGAWSWGLLTGAAVGALVCTRPWTGLILGAVLPAAVWAGRGAAFQRAPLLRRIGALSVGGLPLAGALLGWNARLFGHPLRLGYEAAYGPGHGLGFHPDPWGNAYGVREAVGYTGSDLLLLGTHLLETPLPALVPVALGLVLTPRLLPGAGPLLAWAAAPLAANLLYWHHGIHLGPRFLYEAAPAWSALTVVAAVTLLEGPARAGLPRAAGSWAAGLALAGALLLLPGRLTTVEALTRATASAPPPPSPAAPALVLVHGGWPARVAATLVAEGMRRDSVETVLRRNDLCLAHLHAAWRRSGRGPEPAVDGEPRPGTPTRLRTVEVSPGSRVLLDPDRPLDADCAREIRADRGAGTVELEPLLWRAPPRKGAPVLVARDLGPEGNAPLLEAHPGRTAWVLVERGPGGGSDLVPYGEAMRRIWGGATVADGFGAARAVPGGVGGRSGPGDDPYFAQQAVGGALEAPHGPERMGIYRPLPLGHEALGEP